MSELKLIGAHADKIRAMGASPGMQVVVEVMGPVSMQDTGSFTIVVDDIKVLSTPRNFGEAVERAHVALRIEQSVG